MSAAWLNHMGLVVGDLDEVVGRLRRDHGASLIGEIAQNGQAYRLCYLRGPEGIIVALAEALDSAQSEHTAGT